MQRVATGQILGSNLRGYSGEKGVKGGSTVSLGGLGGVEALCHSASRAAEMGEKNHVCPKCLKLSWSGEASHRKYWL